MIFVGHNLQREDEHSSLATPTQGTLPESSISGTSMVLGSNCNSLPCLVKVRTILSAPHLISCEIY